MKARKRSCRGGTSVLAVFFVVLFAALSLSFAAFSNINLLMSRNHRSSAVSQSAAESGLQYALFLINSYEPPPEGYSPSNTVSESEAVDTFGYFADYVENLLGVSNVSWDDVNMELRIPATGTMPVTQATSGGFSLLFSFEVGSADEPHHLVVTSIGNVDSISRSVGLTLPIVKDSEVLEYAVASRGRMWLTGDSIIDGNIYSSYDNTEVAPFNTTSETVINGTLNTILEKQVCIDEDWQMETLDEYGNPMFDEYGDRIYSPEDEVQGYHEGINYGQEFEEMPGMDISDYNTDGYLDIATNVIPASSDIESEYFPHVAGDYTQPSSYSSRHLNRHVYENQTFTNTQLPSDRNALFKNCTFEGVLYVDCNKNTSQHYNNVRFDNCNFNGTIVTNTPSSLKWQNNALYFTGSATFQNEAMVEATILAPHFNVDLGNTNPVEGETNVLRGAIVGGIVDVRGNAEIQGTIISMCDTTQWTSGYVTNIGATLGDGGSETTDPGDVGTIHITPNPNNMLPSGIVSPIVIKLDENSYVEY